jgi:diguanylate cyclase (GGDEF)-like protein
VRRLLLRIAALETRNTRQILEQVITDNSDAILIADETGRIVEMSVRVSDVFQPPPDLGPGDDMADVLPAQLITETRAALDAIRSGMVPEAPVREVLLPSEQGERCIEYSITPSRLETPDGPSFVVCIAARDVTLRRQQEAKLDRLSRYDELTGALRQSEFVARLDRILSRETRPVAVYSLNLHRFKTINTTLGREVGDELLSNVVRTLKDHDAGVLLVGRTGSDSFCLAHLEPGGLPEAEKFADSLIRVLGYPFIIGDNRATIGIHIGIAVGMPDDTMGGTALLESAEFALDKAREINGSGWTVFDPAASQKIISTRQIERELWRSLERNEIFVTYQPQVDLNSRELIGAEALVRWNNPEFGMISPAEFVEIAEANGFVEKLGEWVLRRACEDAMTWEKPISVAVNVSPLQFSRGDVVGAVKRALNESKLPASRLHLEITESIFLYESADLAQKLKSLRALGVSFALDDFGTGYSSFGYIAHFPPDKIKVDKLFVQNLRDSAANRAILRSVRSLCEGLGVLMICEGVESEDQMAFLRGIGCEQGQGWLFGKAESNDVMRKMAQLAPADAPLESRLDENGTVH